MGGPRQRRWGIGSWGLVMGVVTLLLTACSQDATPTSGATTTPTAVGTASPSEATPSPTPGEVATGGATPGGEASPTGGGPTPADEATTPADGPDVPGGLRLTPAGFGPLELGMSEAAASDTGFIGSIGVGCEPAGTRGAELSPPLAAGDARGQVTFDDGSLTAVTITDAAATEEGVAVGHPLSRVRSVYADATVDVDRSTEAMFGVWLVDVARADGGTYGMIVDPASERVTRLAVPHIQICE